MAEEHNAIKYGVTLSSAAANAAGGGYGDVGVSRLSETLTPVMDLWSKPEWAHLRQERLYARALLIGAVAARNSSVELVNPAGSSVIAVLEQIQAISTVLDVELSLDTGAAIAANPVVTRGVPLDGRQTLVTPGPTSRCTLTTGDLAAGVAAGLLQYRFGNLDLITYPAILVPGSKLFVIQATQNQAFRLNLTWRERNAFPGELTRG